VFIDSLLETEKFVTGRLRAMGGTKFIESVTAEQVVSQNAALNEDQVRAVVSAFGWRASVISGGAGVGKTFSVNTIASLADGANLTVALCAPTGKAAQRLSEMTGRAATTIHRLLEPQRVKEDKGELKFKFGRDESCPLESDIVIVDEVSMVDVRLMKSLLLAIDPNRTTLILVGDHNQLPSVGPAAILRDAIASGICHVTILHKVVRQAGELKLNVSATLDGQVMPTSADALETARSAMVGDSPKIAPWYVFKKDSPQDVRTILHSLFAEKLRTYSIERNGSLDKIDPAWDVQLLTPMHAGPIGTKSLNAMLQRIFQREAGVDVEPWNGEGEPRPLPGDKVIYLRNDQEIGIMNGTMGRVLQRDKGSLIVLWDCVSEPVEIDSERVGNVRLAYAMTVHKSQGSEFPVVVFVCAKPHTIMHHRGLFYTAVSRARQSSIVIGDPWAIANCARTVTLDKRRTLSTYEATTRDVDSEDCGGILSATG
jgi:exodeoxyribonuclease V alpha subunit